MKLTAKSICDSCWCSRWCDKCGKVSSYTAVATKDGTRYLCQMRCASYMYNLATNRDAATFITGMTAERTCRNVSKYGFFECSECGASIVADFCGEFSPDIWVENGKLNYCPNCGARVVQVVQAGA